MANGWQIAYRRVSTEDQSTARQLDGMDGFDKEYEDKLSGKDLKRPAFEDMMSHLREGDFVFVHSMDRLARNLGDLLGTVKAFNAKGASIRFVKENLTFEPGAEASPMATLTLQMLGAFAEFERALIKERQREGIAVAKSRGVYKGRPKGPENPKAVEVRRRHAAGEKLTDIAKDLGISRQSAHTWAKLFDPS